ncbi:stress responsive A/B barrel domain protein [Dactylonectria macrodidyma]|uniref:Stress responsive A/B barrel domain protein n=1 Tax=Dactylonectria macrodidyma TaxID=307937 RepID=A0A9P9EWE8_9HYPO|nr:stress responsive A/B barrel domain protein [Dactylonectria macrodidyma]
MAPITHIVLFKFKAEVSITQVQTVNDDMLTLKDRCLHPDTGKPYILSSKGGSDNSIENLQDGITHAFVVEFASAEDREYYVTKDLAHREFVSGLSAVLAKAQVIDFTPGTF